MFFYSDDPIMDLYRYEAWKDSCGDEEEEDVICPECGCSLEDYCFSVDDEYLCQECFDDAFKVAIHSDDIICDVCGKPIEDDHGYFIDGVYLCKYHAEGAYKVRTPEIDD